MESHKTGEVIMDFKRAKSLSKLEWVSYKDMCKDKL